MKLTAQFIAGIIISIMLSCTSKPERGFYMPGEFEPQEAVWLGWQATEANYPVNIAMIRSLQPHVKIKLVSESDSVLSVAKRIIAENKLDTSSIEFYVIPGNKFWMRDHGAAFVINDMGEMKAIDFEWTSYGYREWLIESFSGNTKKADSLLSLSPPGKRRKVDSMMGVIEKIAIVRSWIGIEGGAIEVNGKGSLILNEDLTLSRNSGISKDSIEKEFKRVLGVTNFIWLPKGLADDPQIIGTITGKYVGIGTGGHTDEYVRFADANTILLAWMPEEEKDRNEVNKINYERMSANYDNLSKAVNEKGKPFKIVKVPLPDLVTKPIKLIDSGNVDDNLNLLASDFKQTDGWKAGDSVYRVSSSSYLNFYVTNGMVLLPTYVDHGTSVQKEESVIQIFQSVFPGRKIIFADAMALNWKGGGLHCGTQQQPKRKMQ